MHRAPRSRTVERGVHVPRHQRERTRAPRPPRGARHPRGRARGTLRALGRKGRAERQQGGDLRGAPARAERDRRQVPGDPDAGHEPLPRAPPAGRRDRRTAPWRGERARAGDRAHPPPEAPPPAPSQGGDAGGEARASGEEGHAPASQRRGVIVSRLALLAWLPLLAACAPRIPPTLQGTFPELTVAQAQTQNITGERVRWGGEIASTTPQSNQTCVEVVSKPLDRRTRPVASDAGSGRFMSCEPGFED